MEVPLARSSDGDGDGDGDGGYYFYSYCGGDGNCDFLLLSLADIGHHYERKSRAIMLPSSHATFESWTIQAMWSSSNTTSMLQTLETTATKLHGSRDATQHSCSMSHVNLTLSPNPSGGFNEGGSW